MALAQGSDGVEPAALQKDLHGVPPAEFLQFLEIVLGRRVHHPEYQRGRIAARDRRIARGHLDLRDLFTQRQGLHQSGQLLRESGEPLEKHFAALNVGEIRLLALAKPRQYPALLVDVLDAQPGAASIGPLRPRERRKHLFRHHPADAFEVVEQLPLLGGQLSRRCQMLQ